jgi:hypothetical protein
VIKNIFEPLYSQSPPFLHGRNNLSFLFEISSWSPYAWTPLSSIYPCNLKTLCRCSLWPCPVVYCNCCTHKPQGPVQRKQHHACLYERASKSPHLFFLYQPIQLFPFLSFTTQLDLVFMMFSPCRCEASLVFPPRFRRTEVKNSSPDPDSYISCTASALNCDTQAHPTLLVFCSVVQVSLLT